jgi:hypothetical protein
MRLLVCGGRKTVSTSVIWDFLDQWHYKTPITVLIQGCAQGADLAARNWAIVRRIPFEDYPVTDWTYRDAGTVRNQRMLEQSKPDAVLAFPGNNGTHDMCNRARLAGIEPFLYGVDQL